MLLLESMYLINKSSETALIYEEDNQIHLTTEKQLDATTGEGKG